MPFRRFASLTLKYVSNLYHHKPDPISPYPHLVSIKSCEDIRVALDHLEPERDIENFVRNYDTGNQIPDPPQLTGSMPQHGTVQKSTLTVRYAHFPRSSQRTNLMQQLLQQHDPGQEYEPVDAGEAGIGAGGRGRVGSSGSVVSEPDGTSRSRAQSRPNSGGPDITALLNRNGVQHAPSSSNLRSAFKPHLDPHAEPIDPTHQQMLLVRENAFKVDPSKDPQTTSESGPGLVSAPPISQFYMQRDYRSSAEILVGPSPDPVGPISPAKSRRSSSPPTASFMRPPRSGPSSTDPVKEIIDNYGQSFPNERRASGLFSRNSPGASSGSNSDAESRNGAGHAPLKSGSNFHAGAQSQDDVASFAERLSRSGSREEHPGVRTGLRSLGPQLPTNNGFLNPYSPISGPSLAPNSSPSAGQPNGSVGGRPGFASASPVPGPGGEEVNVVRVSVPFGTVSDASGRVMRDDLADHYAPQTTFLRNAWSTYRRQHLSHPTKVSTSIDAEEEVNRTFPGILLKRLIKPLITRIRRTPNLVFQRLVDVVFSVRLDDEESSLSREKMSNASLGRQLDGD